MNTRDLFLLGVRRGLPSCAAGAVLVVLLVSCGNPSPESLREQRGSEPSLSELEAGRERLDATVWADEVLAQDYESVFVDLWDRMRATAPDSRLAMLGSLPFQELSIGGGGEARLASSGIRITPLTGVATPYEQGEFQKRLTALGDAGFRLVQSEWHHAAFEKSSLEKLARSVLNIVLHAINVGEDRRVIIRGQLIVDWSAGRDESGKPVPERIGTGEMQVVERTGGAAFRPVAQFVPAEGTADNVLADPVVVADLDGDGFCEIILGGRNEVIQNRAGDFYAPRPLIENLPKIFESAIVADLTGDAEVDFVCVGRDGLLRVYPGQGEGKFSSTPLSWQGANFEMPMVLTAGDIDRDGDLDLWIGQYRPPYKGGHMPSPYYDANDGLPAYLLENDGSGRFRDVTAGSGLDAKRHRRTYAASFVDLNDDGNTDLLVTSDFAGIDLYFGDGGGQFADATSEVIPQRHNFGMSHCFADFDLDGALDFYVTGMSSTTARRLDRLGLGRTDRADIHEMRSQMGHGNRMYLARAEGFVEPDFRDQVARTGWSWGSTAFDFDNDGDRDIYVANGHQSGDSASDYCSTFWRHDIYTGDSRPKAGVQQLFGTTLAPLLRGDISWNGYEHNALLMNEAGAGFLDIGFLMGVAFEFDARAVLSEDLNRDGRMDLLVVENQLTPGGFLHQKLHVLANQLRSGGGWVGVRLVHRETGHSPIGARVMLQAGGRSQIATIVTGDSLYSQHSATAHFGLGDLEKIDTLTVRWSDGAEEILRNPAIGRYHVIVHH